MRKFSSSQQKFVIGIIPGDGIGKEVIPAATRVLQSIPTDFSGATFEFVNLDAGFETFEKTGNSLPPSTIEQLKYVFHFFMKILSFFLADQSENATELSLEQ